jgi:hypothetical protein
MRRYVVEATIELEVFGEDEDDAKWVVHDSFPADDIIHMSHVRSFNVLSVQPLEEQRD